MEVSNTIVKNASTLNETSLSNGSLMRIAPLAIVMRNKPHYQLMKAVYEDVQLTHGNKVVLDASLAYTRALVTLLNNGSKQVI